MATKTSIEWTEYNWNPLSGCSRKSDGCKRCYAEKMTKRLAAMGQAKYQGLLNEQKRFNGVIKFSERDLLAPLKWKKPRKVFVNSMSDLFHENVKDEWIDQIFAVMALTPQHTYQILTKRPERMKEYVNNLRNYNGSLSQFWLGDAIQNIASFVSFQALRDARIDKPLSNVWAGVSVEDQRTADERIPLLWQTPAAIRWISAEPLLGPIDLTHIQFPNESGSMEDWNALDNYGVPSDAPVLDWVIVGGESGPNARPMSLSWARSILQQCKTAGVPAFMKQMGANVWDRNDAGFEGDYPHEWPMDTDTDDWHLDPARQYQGAECRVMLRNRKGSDMSEWPEDLRIRQFPNATESTPPAGKE